MNTNAKGYIMTFCLETLTMILSYIRDQDSATKCHRRDCWQIACSPDPECPFCMRLQLSVENMDGLHVLACIVEFINAILPHRQTENSARVHVIRTRDHGHFHAENLDQSVFKNRKGNFLNILESIIS